MQPMGNSLNPGSRPWDWKTTHDENAMVWKSGCNHKAARYFNERRSWKSSKKIGRKVVGTCLKHHKTYAHGKSWKEQSQLEIRPGGWQNEPCLNEASAFQSHLKKLLPRFKDIWGSAPESIRTPQWAAEEIAGAGGQALTYRYHLLLSIPFFGPISCGLCKPERLTGNGLALTLVALVAFEVRIPKCRAQFSISSVQPLNCGLPELVERYLKHNGKVAQKKNLSASPQLKMEP